MELTDGHITLRKPTDADAAALVRCVKRSLAEMAPWMPWATAEYDEQKAGSWVRGDIEPDAHEFVILDRAGEIAGSCGLNRLDHLNHRANLGYWRSSDHAGMGLATRATRLLACYGFEKLGLHRIEILMAVGNTASRRVAERVGAVPEGILRGRLLLHGDYHDVHSFSLLPGDLGPTTPTG